MQLRLTRIWRSYRTVNNRDEYSLYVRLSQWMETLEGFGRLVSLLSLLSLGRWAAHAHELGALTCRKQHVSWDGAKELLVQHWRKGQQIKCYQKRQNWTLKIETNESFPYGDERTVLIGLIENYVFLFCKGFTQGWVIWTCNKQANYYIEYYEDFCNDQEHKCFDTSVSQCPYRW